MVAKKPDTEIAHMVEMLQFLEAEQHRAQRVAYFRQARLRRKKLLDMRRNGAFAASSMSMNKGVNSPVVFASCSSSVNANVMDFQTQNVQTCTMDKTALVQKARSKRKHLLNLRRNINFTRKSVSSSTIGHASSSTTTISNRTRWLTEKITEPWNFGRPTCICVSCGALHWYEERTEKSRRPKHPKFSMCCMEGRVQLPLLKQPPTLLNDLLDYRGSSNAKHFRRNIRTYNAAFAFTSMGGKVDKKINKQGGPYVFRINGQTHHLIGSLAPVDGNNPKYAQLYVHDTENEIGNRLRVGQCDNGKNSLKENLVRDILHMLDEGNVLVQSYRMVRDTYCQHGIQDLKLRLIRNRSSDGRQYNLPSCSEVAALLIQPSTHGETHRDIIIEHKASGLQRITELHPSFMALQYPLLFPYGEDGFRLGISHHNPENGKSYKQETVTMREYYAFRLQQRATESQVLLRAGRLFQQFLVDAYACIEERNLIWVRNNQKQIRAELYSGLQDAINEGDVMTDAVGRMTILPSSYSCNMAVTKRSHQC